MVLDKPLSEITEVDIKMLISEKVSEGKRVEYKSALFLNKPKEKQEFLADISSFANAVGGFLIIGIVEKNGLPSDIKGLTGVDLDFDKQRMENLIRTSVKLTCI